MVRNEFPPRPYLPASAAAAAGALATSAALLSGAWDGCVATGCATVDVTVLGWCFAVSVVATVAAWWLRRGNRLIETSKALGWLVFGATAAAIASVFWVRAWDARCDEIARADLGACRYVTQSDPSVSAYGASQAAAVYDARGSFLGTVRLTTDEPCDAGTELVLTACRKPLDDSEWSRGRFMKGEVATVDAVRVRSTRRSTVFDLIGRLREAVLAAIEPQRSDGRALIAGIVCGRTTELNQTSARDAFATAGLTHLVAVSGSHLALIAALLQGALQRLRVGPTGRAALLLAVMAAYVVFTGCAPSAVRSVAMVACSMLAGLGERRAHPLSGLAITVTVLVVQNPGVTFDLGFQLSAVSVLFILLFSRYLAHLIGKLHVPDSVAEALGLTLAAQAATIPLTVPVFGTLSLVAPLANLVVGPVMTDLLVSGLVVAPMCAAVPILAPLMAVPEGLANASIFLANVLSSLPLASIPVSCTVLQLLLCYLLAALLYLTWRDWTGRQAAIALLLALGAMGGHLARWMLFAPAAVTVLDVGQADAILVRDGAGSLLVDAGVDSAVVTALARNHVYRLDAVAITHWDRDHWGGLSDLLATVEVGRLIVPEGAASGMPPELRAAFNGEIVEVHAGDALRIGDFTCETVWPREPVDGDENAGSLCLDVSYRRGERTLDALLTGDAERDSLDAFAQEVGDIDLLKVGHHGSKISVDDRSLAALDPEVSVASAGAGNRYGHPTRECIDSIEASGSAFLCTIDTGDVAVYPGVRGVRIQTSRTVP